MRRRWDKDIVLGTSEATAPVRERVETTALHWAWAGSLGRKIFHNGILARLIKPNTTDNKVMRAVARPQLPIVRAPTYS